MSVDLEMCWNIFTFCNNCKKSIMNIFDITYDNIFDALTLSCCDNKNLNNFTFLLPVILPEINNLKNKISYFNLVIFMPSYSKYININTIDNDIELSHALNTMQCNRIYKIEMTTNINFVPVKVILNDSFQIYIFDPTTKIKKAISIIKNNYNIIDFQHYHNTCDTIGSLFDNVHCVYVIATSLINPIFLY